MYGDRIVAGERLAEALKAQAGPGTVILAIPRGGGVGGEVTARTLGAPRGVGVPRAVGPPARTAIVCVDGVAAGGASVAAIRGGRAQGAATVVLALTVAPPQT